MFLKRIFCLLPKLNFSLFIIIVLAFLSLTTSAQNQKSFLEINGKTLNNKGKQVNPINISVFENGFELYKFDSKSGIKLTFESNRYYTILVKAKGFNPSTIIVDSSIPKKKEKDSFRFEFEYQLTDESDTTKKENAELPAAIIKYYKEKRGFTISDKYNSFIKETGSKK
jgi:hypothetical protein